MLNHEDLQLCEYDVSMIGFFSLAKASLAQSGILRIITNINVQEDTYPNLFIKHGTQLNIKHQNSRIHWPDPTRSSSNSIPADDSFGFQSPMNKQPPEKIPTQSKTNPAKYSPIRQV